MLPCGLSSSLRVPIRPSISCQQLRHLRTRSRPIRRGGEPAFINQDDVERQTAAPNQQHSTASRVLHNPSESLVKALEARNLKHLVQESPPWKVDLSYVNPNKYDPSAWRAALSRKSGTQVDIRNIQRAPRKSPQTIVARQILAEYHNTTHFQVFGPQLIASEAKYIAARGYNNADIMVWVSILTTEDGDDAARTFRTGTANTTGTGHSMDQPIPAFLPLTLLRRPHLSPTALRDIIIRLWAELRRHNRIPHVRFTLTSVPMFLIIVRLLRHARRSWPAALVTVTQMFLHYFTLPVELKRPSHRTFIAKIKRQTLLYNKMLSLLSLPTRPDPFNAIPYHQRAQFDIVGAMANHDPPLNITREGFQAIVSVQLAHRKTPQEQDWSQLKIKSWPPWKQDKTGLDAEKDQEYGSPRALQAIRRAAEAGYSPGYWEQTAKILSGWDLDNSPTIQTRSNQLHRYMSLDRPLEYWGGLDKQNAVPNLSQRSLWVARIEATRTVREAWACFLSYQDLVLTRPQSDHRIHVYNAMLVKLLAKEQVSEPIEEERRNELRSLEPGDSREILPEPIAPREITWVHTPPPTVEELVREMVLFKIVIRDHTLTLLLWRTRNLARGLHWLYLASLTQTRVRYLLKPQVDDPAQLQEVPHTVFMAFLRLLCRFPSYTRSHLIGESGLEWKPSLTPFFHAVRLLQSRPGSVSEGLKIILKPLESSRSTITGIDEEESADAPTPISWIRRLRFMQNLVRNIAVTNTNALYSAGFEHLHLSLHERALIAAFELKSQWDQTPAKLAAEDVVSYVNDLLESTSSRMRKRFYSIAEGATSEDPSLERSNHSLAPLQMPSLLRVPNPHVLHGLVRLLGFLRDYRGIVDLFSWLQWHEHVIAATAHEPRNGRAMLRRTAIAARVCFERAWVADQDTGEMSRLSADESMQQELEAIVRESQLFGGWPDDMDVWRYVEKDIANFPPGDE